MDLFQTTELFRRAILLVCVSGLVICAVVMAILSLVRLWKTETFQRFRQSGALVGLSVFAVALLFNAFPTQADKNRANGSGPPGHQDAPVVTPRSGPDGGEAACLFHVCPVAELGEAPAFPAWTNAIDSLCISGIALGQTSVWMRVSWPTDEPPPHSMLDVFSARDCDTNIWTQCGVVSVPSSTNEVVIVAFVSDSTIMSISRQFFRVGTKTDSDDDGLTDTYERLVSRTNPMNYDSDGDGVPDGWEEENGLNPNLWSDAYADPDGDGIPNLYEYHNGAQPQISDADQVVRIVAGGSGTNAVATLSAALAASHPYSVIEVADGVHEGDGWAGLSVTLPDYPVLITSSDGGRSRRAVIRHTTQLAAMYLNATQTTHTVVQGLCYDLVATNGMQMAFWCGGNLPWNGAPAAGMFRDIYVRMPNPGVVYEGWFFRHYESNEVVIASCIVNAFGATSARGIYAIDSPPMSVENCTFVNFPSNDGGLGYGIQYESTAQNWGGAPDPIPLEIVNCLFDNSFTNAYALAPLENGVAYEVSMLNCIVPSALEYEADYVDGVIVTNAGVSSSGHIANDSPARGAGIAPLYAPLDIDGQDRVGAVDIGADQLIPDSGSVDTDGDGLSDADEDWVYGSDPFFADSDWDGSPDGAEVANGTDPLDQQSYFVSVTLMVTNKYATASVTNYFGFSWTATGWDVTNVSATTSCGMASNVVVSTTGLYGKAFSDLNRNGVYDEDMDVISIVSLAGNYAIVNATIVLGDIDDDGVSDAKERNEGTDPYNNDNFLLRATVKIMDSDTGHGITNYVAYSAAMSEASPVASNAFAAATFSYSVSAVTQEGKIYVRGFRDLNGNGVYDEGVDGMFSCDLSSGSNGKTVNTVIGDSDGDAIRDGVEILDGTNPMNASNYVCSVTGTITEIFSTTNALSAKAFFGTNVLACVANLTNIRWTVVFGRCETQTHELPFIELWDDLNDNGERDENESYSRSYFAVAEQLNATNIISYGRFDVDNDGLLDYWEEQTGLSELSVPHGFALDSDGDGLCNMFEFWSGTNPLAPDGSNTFLSVISRSIDERICGRIPSTALDIYVNYPMSSLSCLQRNTQSWVNDVDFSCISVWNDSDKPREHAGVLISSMHVLFARHWPLGVGRTIFFQTNEGGIESRSIVSTHIIPDNETDIILGVLNSPITNITPVAIFPADISNVIGRGTNIPIMLVNQDRKASVAEVGAFVCHESIDCPPTFMSTKGTSPNRADFVFLQRSGDSGYPSFALVGNQLVLLGMRWMVALGTDRSIDSNIFKYSSKIQQLMDASVPGCSLNLFDWSEYVQSQGGD